MKITGRVEEEEHQSLFNLVCCEPCSVKLALIEFITVCLMLSPMYCSVTGFRTCRRRKKKKKDLHERMIKLIISYK